MPVKYKTSEKNRELDEFCNIFMCNKCFRMLKKDENGKYYCENKECGE